MSTEDVARFIAEASFDRLPLDVITQAKVAIRDTLGVALAAHKDRAVQVAQRVATAMNGRQESTLMGIGVKVPCNIAAWVNAIMATTLDMDDGAMGTAGHKGHFGGIVVPSSLAVAERQNATGKGLIEAVVVGYEVGLRTGWIMGKAGNIPISGAVGVYGAAAAAVKLLGLSPKEIVDALGIAEGHSPHPSWETIFEQRGMVKEAMGWAAMTGVTGALLAQEGFGGPRTIYDLPNYDKKPLGTLGKEWEILGLYFKPYCACRSCHAPLDGVLELVQEHNLNVDDILSITVGVPAALVEGFAKYRPATIWQAQYSMPFTIGAALADKEVGPEQIVESRLGDKAILSVADKVKLVADPEVDGLRPGSMGAKVKIETKGGRNFETLIRYPRGEPQNPLNEEELSGKFRKLAIMAMGADRAEDLSKCLDRLENLRSINELVDKISYLG